MLIALLIALGVDLVVVVVFAALVLGRRRWLKRQPGEFAGAIRVSSGDVDGLSPKQQRIQSPAMSPRAASAPQVPLWARSRPAFPSQTKSLLNSLSAVQTEGDPGRFKCLS